MVLMTIPWLVKVMEHVAAVKPHFVAIHCQEVGGKNSEKGMAHVPKFIESMRELGAEQVRSFTTISGFSFHFFTLTEKQCN